MCELWSKDTLSAADKNGVVSMDARVSLFGNLKVRDRDEFSTMFGAATQDGFFDRMIIAPGPDEWEFDWNWKPPQEPEAVPVVAADVSHLLPLQYPRPVGRVTVPRSAFGMLKEWDQAHRGTGVKPGRLGEVALRTALISASANGDREVTAACMVAALAFADWQMQVRKVYVAGEAENDDAKVTGLLMSAFEEVEQSLTEGNPRQVAGKPIIDHAGWTNFRLLQQSKSWHKRYSASMVGRNLAALVQQGMLERDYDEDTKQPTNKYRLPKDAK
jgi:hypothetical protein